MMIMFSLFSLELISIWMFSMCGFVPLLLLLLLSKYLVICDTNRTLLFGRFSLKFIQLWLAHMFEAFYIEPEQQAFCSQFALIKFAD